MKYTQSPWTVASSRPTFRRIAVWIFLLLLVGWSCEGLLAQAVNTRVEITAPLFKDALGEERSVVEREVASIIADQGSAYFSFLDWHPETLETAAPNLIMRLHEKQVGIGSKVYASFLMKIGDQEAAIPQIPDIELYKSWQPDLPNHDSDRLIQDLEQMIVARFENSDFRARLQTDFLAQIAIADDVIVEPNRVVLPVSGQKLKASKESELLVHFLARRPQGSPGSGQMELNPLITIASPPRKGLVQCMVDFFFFEGLDQPIQSTTWDSEIESVLQNKTEVKVFMKRYVKDVSLGFHNGLAEEP